MTRKAPWKSPGTKQSNITKASFHKRRSFAERKVKEAERSAAVDMQRKLVEGEKAKRAFKAKKIAAKQEKKKQEDLRAGNVQVVKKLRKLDRKALNKLIKMTPEQIQALAK